MKKSQKDKIKKIVAIVSIISILSQAGLVSFADSAKKINVNTPSVNNNAVTIGGSVSSGEKANLKLEVTKSGAVVYDCTKMTDDDGKFSFDFTLEQGENNEEYQYVIKETIGENAVDNIFTDDFANYTAGNYLVSGGEVSSSVGKTAPSLYLASGKRQIKTIDQTGVIDIYADVYIESTGSNTTLITASSSKGNTTGCDTTVNTSSMSDAFKINTNGNNLVVEYADNNTSQTDSSKKMSIIQENYELNTWYNIHIMMNTDTLELKTYLNGNEVLSDVDKYIFKMTDYKRILDTKAVNVPIYLDNIKITKTTPYVSLDLENSMGTFTVPAKETTTTPDTPVEPDEPTDENTYILNVTDAYATDNNLTVSGNVKPKKSLSLVLTVKDGSNVIRTTEGTSDENGNFKLTAALPESKTDKTYTYVLSLKETEPNYVKLYENTEFLMSESYVVKTFTTDTTIGNDAPSAKITGGKRLLKSVDEMKVDTGIFVGEVEFMQTAVENFDLVWSMSDSTGNLTPFRVSLGGGNINLSVQSKENNFTTTTIFNGYEANKWYKLKAVMNLDKRYMNFYVDDTLVAENVAISSNITNLNRALNVQTNSGTVYIDNARFYQDTAEYCNVEDVTDTVVNAGSDTVVAALASVASSTADTVYSVLQTYKTALNVDLALYDSVTNKSYINNQLHGKSFLTVDDFRKAYNGAIAFGIIKESNSSNIIQNIKNNLLLLDLTSDETVIDTDEFKEKINNNISSVATTSELQKLIKYSEVFAALKTSTQFKVKNVIDTYKDILTSIGLTSDFFALTDTQASNAAKAVFADSDSGNDVEQLLKNIVARLNTATEKAKQPTIGGTGNTGLSISTPSVSVPNTTVQSSAISAGNVTSAFNDLQQTHWAYNAVMSLVGKKIMVGTSDSSFEPDQSTTREQFVKIITGALGIEATDEEIAFTDTDKNAWYYGYVSSAVNNGLIYGIDDETFGVGKNITRQDAAVILYRAKDKFGLSEGSDATKFEDDENIADYAKDAVYFLKGCGALSGNENDEFLPEKSLSRAEAAMLMYNIINGSTSNTNNDDEVITTSETKAQNLLASLGIPTSFASTNLTKGEWANLLAITLKLDGGADKDYFTDIENSEYKDAINALAAKNIIPISSMYEPDSSITLEQAVQNAVYALGWGIDDNYKRTAGQLGLIDSVKLNYADLLDETSAAQLIYNMLNANYLYDKNSDSVTSDNEHTLLGSYYKVVKTKGKITATEDVALPNYISSCGEGQIRIDDELIYVGNTDIDQYLGYKVEVFLMEDNGEYTALCYSVLSDNDILTIDIADIDTVQGFDEGDDYDYRVSPSIKYYKNTSSKTVRLSRNSTIIYNNAITNNAENSDFTGDSGSVVLTDTDGDGKYDMVSVKKYKTYIVAGYDTSSNSVSFKDSKFILKPQQISDVKIYKNNRTVEASAIAENDVLCLYCEKVDDDAINSSDKATIYISADSTTGKVTSIKTSTRIATVDGKAYKVSPTAMNEIASGKTQKLYLDISGIIVKAEDVADDYDYIYVMSMFKNDGGNGASLKYITKTNQKAETPFAKKVTYTGKDENGIWVERKSYKADALYEMLSTVITGHTLVKAKIVDDEITMLTMAADMTGTNDYRGYTDNAFTLDGTATEAVSNNQILTSNYGAVSGTTLLMLDYTDNEEDSEFVYYAKSDYNTLSHLFRFVQEMYIYDANSNLDAGVCVIKLDKTLDKEVTAWQANANNVVVVESIIEIVNEDNEPVYKIEGWCGGQTVSYETVDQNVGKMFKTYWSGNTSKDKVSELEFGDVIRVDTDAANKVYTIDVLACVDDVKNTTVVYGGNEYEWLRTYYGPVWKNYDNKILRLVGQEGQMLPVTGTIYLCDLASKDISVVGAGVYINDSDTSNPDTVFVRKKKGIVSEIVVFRK